MKRAVQEYSLGQDKISLDSVILTHGERNMQKPQSDRRARRKAGGEDTRLAVIPSLSHADAQDSTCGCHMSRWVARFEAEGDNSGSGHVTAVTVRLSAWSLEHHGASLLLKHSLLACRTLGIFQLLRLRFSPLDLLQGSSPCLPVRIPALPGHRLQGSPLPPAPGDGRLPLPPGLVPGAGARDGDRGWYPGLGPGPGPSSALCRLPEHRARCYAGSAPGQRRWRGRGRPPCLPMVTAATAIAPNGNAKGPKKAPGVKIRPCGALRAFIALQCGFLHPNLSFLLCFG
ncbi:PREDICTED: uncharacterized protein LOC106885471 [Calidris pugnax]|uniref:uncharacterized protein LOC106885471 n=1 Tax=Calidris pugnax TaxID=198806 RepID=UPI00071D0351|nr:PREDICTED: uncharacterized protein LOC106885471 [Calidris pugnax]XP_014793172.1 PREDICTED: uncharacterized protein LOC106885471 [Calidris pugnax]